LSRKNINDIVNQAERLLQHIKDFYGYLLYTDKEREDEGRLKKNNYTIVNSKSTGNMKKEAVAELDIFGNLIVRQEPWEFADSLEELNSMISSCKKCPLGNSRTNFVFGTGNPDADIVVIGEAPGAEEDLQGEPFVGRAGQLLNRILEATGFKREEVYIMNILKCRPPGNRNPLPEEVEKCRPYLEKQLKLINPKIILLLGKVAADALLKTREPLQKLRGKVHTYKNWKVMVTFHPAALLRNPNWKRPAWEDMQNFRDFYKTL
jgi:DNA polymerase